MSKTTEFIFRKIKAQNPGPLSATLTRAPRKKAMNNPETWSMFITLAVLATTVVFFALGKIRSDLVAVCALLCLMLFGVLTPAEALSGFSNSIIITIAGMFVVGGAIVRTGLAGVISNKIVATVGTNQNVLFMVFMLVTALIGSLVSNTGTVAIMMPIVVSLALSINVSPSRFLMPLAFMSSMGGMLTLIGNPPNMVVNDVYTKAGFEPLTLFSFFPVGVVCMVFGLFILAPVTSYFLSRRKAEKTEGGDKGRSLFDLIEQYKLSSNIYKVRIPEAAPLEPSAQGSSAQEASPMSGKTLMELALTGRFGVAVQEIRRAPKRGGGLFGHAEDEQIAPAADTLLLAGDVLYCQGSQEHIQAFAQAMGLEFIGILENEEGGEKFRFDSFGVCEVVLMSSSNLVDRTVEESRLREQYGINVLGIHRGDQYILDEIKSQVMRPGDALLVQGSWENLGRLDDKTRHWVVVGQPGEQASDSKLRKKIPFVSLVILLMIASMATGLLPTVVAVMGAAVLMILGGCFRNVEGAYSAINWETIVMISAMLPMAIAMEKSGILGIVAGVMTEIGREHGPLAALAVVYGVTSFMNIIISQTPVALLVAPVAIQIAVDLNCNPLPFVFGVATAACMCFASPFSTPSNALVMSAGRYTFFDYLKIGLPLQALMA
ncbi:SLC13 family permease, partial [Desulfovibrio sp. OttesenSCG-928-C14]|nr:SLC13 family permease [Desulfovibrio sp. OttesenSCG-928-C14]